MIYVASPYSHKNPIVEDHRFTMAEEYVAACFRQRLVAFSPIYYCHPLSRKLKLPGDYKFWKDFNNTMMRRAEQIHVLQLIGWRESRGVQYELNMAQELCIEIIYVEYTNEPFPEGGL